MEKREDQPIDYWAIFKRHHRIILVSTFALLIATWILTKLAPKTYEASTILFVYSDISGDVNLSAAAAGIMTPTAHDYLLILLKSDSLTQSVVSGLNPEQKRKLFGAKEPSSIRALISGLKSHVKVTSNFNRTIIVSADTGDPGLSADLANAYINILRSSIIDRAKAKTVFLAEQVLRVKEELAQDEEALQKFQETKHWIDFDSQMREKLAIQADTERDLLLDRIQLNRNRKLSETSGAVRELVQLEAERTALQVEIAMREANLKKMETNFQHLPATSLTWVRLTREVAAKAELIKVLTQEYEASAMRQDQDIIPYRVIDKAFPPMSPIRPVMRTNLTLGIFFGSLLGTVLAFLLDYLQGLPPGYPGGKTSQTTPEGPEVVW